jgi:pyruvate formate lyase activating enzyme
MSETTSWAEALRRQTSAAAGELVRPLHDGWLQCLACGHACRIPPGRPGICQVRFNDAGTLRVPRGYVAALVCDPIEKKPFFHALPGTEALSFGMLGCDLHCAYCQNWETSQAIRDPEALAPPRPISAEAIVARALALGASTVASTYNEPLITAEWAVEVFREAKRHGLRTAFISNGNGTPEVIDYLRPWVDFYKVDLKSFSDRNYRQLGGRIDRILDTIPRLVGLGFWVEIVTLVIPGFNDSDAELTDIARYLAAISPDIPWHVTGFHKDYKMTDPDDTPVATLMHAWEIGRNAGLRYVYAGNRPGRTGDHENTRCSQCQRLLVERIGFRILRNELRDGRCPGCDAVIPGIWS